MIGEKFKFEHLLSPKFNFGVKCIKQMNSFLRGVLLKQQLKCTNGVSVAKAKAKLRTQNQSTNYYDMRRPILS